MLTSTFSITSTADGSFRATEDGKRGAWVLKPDGNEYRIVRDNGPSSQQYAVFSMEEEGTVGYAVAGNQLEDGDSAVLQLARDSGVLLHLMNEMRLSKQMGELTEVH